MRKYSILLVDDEPLITIGVGNDLEKKGYEVTTADSGEKAIELLNKARFDLVMTDLIMDRIDGIDVLKKSKEINPESMVIILTGFGDITSAIDAVRLDADDYILKPCESEEIYFRVSSCLEELELRRKIKLYEDLLPVCCVCKKIRDDFGKEPGTGRWVKMEDYIRDKGGIEVTSGYCPECARKAMEEFERNSLKLKNISDNQG